MNKDEEKTKVLELKQSGKTQKEIATELGFSRSKVWKLLQASKPKSAPAPENPSEVIVVA
jgi:orotate phosphoribosyltransferase-like protein